MQNFYVKFKVVYIRMYAECRLHPLSLIAPPRSWTAPSQPKRPIRQCLATRPGAVEDLLSVSCHGYSNYHKPLMQYENIANIIIMWLYFDYIICIYMYMYNYAWCYLLKSVNMAYTVGAIDIATALPVTFQLKATSSHIICV